MHYYSLYIDEVKCNVCKHVLGTGQCIVTHDETGVDLYIVVVRIYSV